MSNRLKSHVVVDAVRKTASASGSFVTIAHQGDSDAGIVHLLIDRGKCVDLWSETSSADGLTWRPRALSVARSDAEERMAKERSFDADLWLIDIEGDLATDLLPGVFTDEGS